MPEPTGNTKEWFDSFAENEWLTNSSEDVTMKGLSTTALNTVKLGSYVVETTSTAISGRKLTGTFKRIWSESDTETRKKGISVAGKIGVFYYNKKEE